LRRLFAVAEAYPNLKASQNFLALQKQITDLEDQLQLARRYYNDTVRNFNTDIQSFPEVVFAGLMGFRQEHYFQIDADTGATPTVSFQAT
jgi:LemA protein